MKARNPQDNGRRKAVFCAAVCAGLLVTWMLPAPIAVAHEGLPDSAYGAINPSHQVSDSPLLRLSTDKMNWPAVLPPEPREPTEEVEDPTATQIYNVATGEVIAIPSLGLTPKAPKPGFTLIPPYEGLLPPGYLPKTVFPPDDRARVTSTTSYPWRTVSKLFITAADMTGWVGSGAIIGCPDGHGYHVLTAGHNVYMHSHGGWVISIEVVPGLDHNYMPFFHAWATLYRTYTGWVEDQNHNHDWALVTLDRNVGDYTGSMGRITTGDLDWYENVFNSAGYPTDLDCGVPNSSGLCMYWDSDNGRVATQHNHWYYMDTFEGQSGMPIWSFDGESRYIATVHAYGDDGSSSNHGTRLNQDKFDRIIEWCNLDTPPGDFADLIDDGQVYSGFDPRCVVPGETHFDVWCDIRNIGTASSGGFYVSYYASTDITITTSDHLIDTDYVGSISPFISRDSDWSGTFPSSVPAGTYWVGWIIDSQNDVDESDESNNTAYKTYYQLEVKDSGCPEAPSITEWGLIVLVVLLMLSAWVVLRRRKAVLSRQ